MKRSVSAGNPKQQRQFLYRPWSAPGAAMGTGTTRARHNREIYLSWY